MGAYITYLNRIVRAADIRGCVPVQGEDAIMAVDVVTYIHRWGHPDGGQDYNGDVWLPLHYTFSSRRVER